MYYDEKPRRRKAQRPSPARPAAPERPPRRRRGCLFRLFSLAVKLGLLCAALICLMYFYPVGLFSSRTDVSASKELPGGYTNILLLGVDVDAGRTSRSDTIIIASIGSGHVKLTSLLRDTQVEIPGHGTGKLNSAYAHGGPELVMRTVNEAFHMNVEHYALVDYFAFPPLVDAVGGVEIAVTQEELYEVNRNITQCWNGFVQRGYEIVPLEVWGENVRLDGLQALAYARIRKIGYDYQRTSRQRTVLNALLAKARANLYNPFLVAELAGAALDNIETNLTKADLLSLGVKALLSGGLEQLRLPADHTFTEDGSYLVPDLEKNRALLKEFIYE